MNKCQGLRWVRLHVSGQGGRAAGEDREGLRPQARGPSRGPWGCHAEPLSHWVVVLWAGWSWNVDAKNLARPFSCCRVTTDTFGCCGSETAELGSQDMGDHWQRSLRSSHALEAEGRSDSRPDAASLALQSPVCRPPGPQAPRPQDLDIREPRLEEEEEGAPLENTAREEFSGPQNPQEALSGMGKALEKDTEEAVPEMRWAVGSGWWARGSQAWLWSRGRAAPRMPQPGLPSQDGQTALQLRSLGPGVRPAPAIPS